MDEIIFAVSTDLKPIQNMKLEANFAECKAALRERMEPYASLVITEEGIQGAKKDLAEIRKIRKAIDEARKTTQDLYCTPLEAFKAQAKELMGECDKAIENLSGQVQNFDILRREEKLRGLQQFFEATVEDMAAYLRWEQIFDARWGNVTFAAEKAQGVIADSIEKCRQDVDTILGMNSPFEAALLDEYRQRHDLGACLQKAQELQRLEDKAREAKTAREAARQTQRLSTPSTDRAEGLGARTGGKPVQDGENTSEGAQKLHVVDFRIWATTEQLGALRTYLQRAGIRYGRPEPHRR